MALRRGGRVCFCSQPTQRVVVLPVLKPTLLLCDEFDTFQLDNVLTDVICRQKTRQQQSLWKLFVRNVHFLVGSQP